MRVGSALFNVFLGLRRFARGSVVISSLLYDLAACWRLLIRDDDLSLGVLIDVILSGMDLRGEPKTDQYVEKSYELYKACFHRKAPVA